ncbi:MAG: hypothetical protein JW864_15230 [Spirochaetes bacterium]|nr:hypothetical protein [Spirochaetota bacterium]
MKKIIIFIMFALILSCGRWKSTKLKSDLLCSIPSGEAPGKVMLKYDEDNILEISFKIGFYNNNIYLADSNLKTLHVLNKSGEPLMYIGDKKYDQDEYKDIKFSRFKFSIIESISVDSAGNIYVQNSFVSSTRRHDMGFSPSYILVFNADGNLLYTLGKTGSPDIPFNSIESMKIDSSDRLFVISRSYDTWSIFRFRHRKKDFSANFSEIDLKDQDGDKTYSGKIEKIIAYKSGNNLLLSVAYYYETEFRYRKIYNYSIPNEKIERTVFIIPEPKNELFSLIENENIYLWDIYNDDVRFIVTNFKGDIVNNVYIKFPHFNNSFNEITMDSSGQFYSYHVRKKGIEIYEWR